MAIQNEWDFKHFEFQNAFPNKGLDRSVYTELIRELFIKEKWVTIVIKLRIRLYGLKDEARMWVQSTKSEHVAAELKAVHSAPCIFQSGGIIAV